MSTGRKLVVKAMLESGLSYRQIAASENISLDTVHSIAYDPEIVELTPGLLDKTKRMLAGRAYLLADRSISKAGEEDRLDKMNAYQLTIMSSVMIDKARLMDGQSTENLALHTLSEQLQSGAKDIDNVKDMIIKRFKIMSDNGSEVNTGQPVDNSTNEAKMDGNQ